MDQKERALYFFRKMVYCIYTEIGSLQASVHPELMEKAKSNTPFFHGDRKKQTALIYLEIEQEQKTNRILSPFKQRTGLSLQDVQRAFSEGNWQNRFHQYTFGGPRWVAITEKTVQLKELIDEENWEKADELTYEIKGLKTNFNYLIEEFEKTERFR